jgi:aminoglycoside phosphotransferase (APT) family kinase protein
VPNATERDPVQTSEIIGGWLSEHLGAVGSVVVSNLQAPPANGFSSETLLFDAQWTSPGGDETQRPMVIRVRPTAHTVFLNPDFSVQYRVQKALCGTPGIPLPDIHWYEENSALLGAPFYAMTRVAGVVPEDSPPYTFGGWVLDADAEDQRRLWWSGIEAMAAVHRTDWQALDLHFLDDSSRGTLGLDQQLSYYREFLSWASEGLPQPVPEATLSWLETNRPPEEHPPVLCWGDSRLGNMIFEDFACRAVLDWEMTTLAQPELDLAWWLWFDRQFSEGLGVGRPPGFPTPAETVARYEELLGREVRHLDWYEVFAGFRFSVVLVRLASLLRHEDLLPVESDFQTNNLCTQLLAKTLGFPAPKGAH